MSHSIREFITHHDERWLFVVIYITLAVVLSIVLSLFWLVAVAVLHFGLEYLRQGQYRQGVAEVVSHAVWEIKLDIALVVLALAMSLYMNVVLGILGLQSAARAAAATRVVRFAAWERNIRAIILLSDDVARVIQIGVSRLLRRPPPSAEDRAVALAVRTDGSAVASSVDAAAGSRGAIVGAHVSSRGGHAGASAGARAGFEAQSGSSEQKSAPRSWRDAWSRGDRLTIALLAASVALILMAPLMTEHSWVGATQALLSELRPFPSR
jgi:hypothetical protein